MINKETVKAIKHELLTSIKSITEIAEHYKVSRATVTNINCGKSHREDTQYPLRQNINFKFSNNDVAFIRKLSNEGYSAKQIHIMLSQGAYSTISNILSFKTREEIDYEYDAALEERKTIFDILVTPSPHLINKYTDALTIEDAQYIKFLGRFMAPLIDVIETYLPIIESDMIGFQHKITTRDDLERYLEWGGTSFGTVWLIKNIYNNKFNKLKGEPIFYTDFSTLSFLGEYPDLNLDIANEMVTFDTKENFKKGE